MNQVYCPRCRWRGTKDGCGRNPHFGYLRCPRCERSGYDILVEDDQLTLFRGQPNMPDQHAQP